ncbi:hypothetical protein NQZ79_g7966 [Umbelopsis isabellina]|nr:hypothetical protein NQZ79_g7966 [Umbelopsis isabellina]
MVPQQIANVSADINQGITLTHYELLKKNGLTDIFQVVDQVIDIVEIRVSATEHPLNKYANAFVGKESRKIPLREIGKTSVKISAIGYGGMSLAPGIYGETDDEDSVNLLIYALDISCNFWDTAGNSSYLKMKIKMGLCWARLCTDVYGQGHSEEVTSRVLKDRRKEKFLATKFGEDYSSGTFKINDSPEYLEYALIHYLNAYKRIISISVTVTASI